MSIQIDITEQVSPVNAATIDRPDLSLTGNTYNKTQIDMKVSTDSAYVGEANGFNAPYNLKSFESYIVVEPIASPNNWGNLTVSQLELNNNTVYFHVKDGVVSVFKQPSISGKSAYELAVANGSFVGTLAEYLISLKGADGENKIEKWEAKAYTSGQQVITDDGWFGVRDGMNATATDIPGISDKWEIILDSVSKNDISYKVYKEKQETIFTGADFEQGFYYQNGVKIPSVANRLLTIDVKKGQVFLGKFMNFTGINYNIEIRYDDGSVFKSKAYNGAYVQENFIIKGKGKLYFSLNTEAQQAGNLTYASLTDFTYDDILLKDALNGIGLKTSAENLPQNTLVESNYFNLGTAVIGSTIYPNGYSSNSAYNTSKLEKVSKGDVIEYTGTYGNAGIALFNENGVFVDKVLWDSVIITANKIQKTITQDGFIAVSFNTPYTLDIYRKNKINTQSSSGTVDLFASKGIVYLDDEYLYSDNFDYGITINRIIQSMPSNGGCISISAKDYEIKTTVIIDRNLTFIGLGACNFHLNKWLSCFYTNSATLIMFLVNEAVTPYFEKIHFYNKNSNPTEGCAIKVIGAEVVGQSPNTLGSEYFSASSGGLSRCSVVGFYDNLDFSGYSQWGMSDCLINGHVRYGLIVDCVQNRDAGDSRIISCDFYSKYPGRTSEAHIYIKGSGGLKILGTKFNAYANYCILGNILHNTVILLINGNSFENYYLGAIKLSKQVSVYRHINIIGNEFDSYQSGVKDISIYGLSHVNILGNSFSSGETSASNIAINLNGVTNARLLNTYNGYYTNPINIYACTDVKEATLQVPTSTNNNV